MKRALEIAALLLLLGAIENIAIAWASAAWVDVRAGSREAGATKLDDGAWWMVASYGGATAQRLHAIWGPLETAAVWHDAGRTPADAVAGKLSPLVEPPASGGRGAGARVVDARGWPMRSMWSAIELEAQIDPIFTVGKVTRVVRGFELEPQMIAAGEAPQHLYRLLPLGVIWSGFAINTALFAAAAAVLLCAVRFSRRALRAGAGRCPRCAYDLRSAAHERCPECGRRLRAGWNGRRGARRLRAAVIVGGAALVVAALALGGAWVVRRAAWKPAWWLIADARSADERRSALSLDELLARLTAGDLSSETTASLVREALALQADAARPWLTQWGDIIVEARSKALVRDDQWLTFAHQAVALELRARREMIEGDPLAAKIIVHMRGSSHPALACEMTHSTTRLGERWLTSSLSRGDRHPLQFAVPLVGSLVVADYTQRLLPDLSHGDRADIEPGDHTLRAFWSIAVADAPQAGFDSGRRLFNDMFERKAAVRILPQGSETVELVIDESMRPAVEAALRLEPLHADVPGPAPRVYATFDSIGPLPIDVAFDVFVRVGDREWPIGQIDSERESLWGPRRNLHGKTDALPWGTECADLILRPSRAAARRTVGITRIWGGTIVIEHVPVRWSGQIVQRRLPL